MASFKIRNVNTLQEYEIKVGSCILYGARKQSNSTFPTGQIASVDSGGYMHVISNGDILTDVIPFDEWLINEYAFVNNPDYTLKVEAIHSGSFGNRLLTHVQNNESVTINYRYATLSVYKSGIRTLSEIWSITDITNTYDNNTPYGTFFNQAAFGSATNCIMIDRLNEMFYLYHPYIGHICNFDTVIDNSLVTYKQDDVLIIDEKITPPFDFNIYTDFNYQYLFMGVPRRAMNANSYTTKELSKQNLITTINRSGTSNSAFTTLYNWEVRQRCDYTFLYALLWDKLPDDDEGGNPYPDPTPPTPSQPDPEPPPYDGGNGNPDNGSDPIPKPDVPTISVVSTGSVTLYRVANDVFRQLNEYIWTNPKFVAMAKLFSDPMQAILSAHLITVNVPVLGTNDIVIGNVNTEIKAAVIPNNFISVDFGSVNITEYYGDADDYDTIVQVYLPYYGYVTLNTYEVMNAKLSLSYNIDLLTGAFTAFLSVEKNVKNTSLNSVLYQYNGAMAYQIPMSAQDFSSVVTGMLNLAQLRPNISDFHVGYERASSLSGNNGVISVKTAYLTIMRTIHAYTQERSKYVGYPYQQTIQLGNVKGYTKCLNVFIDKVIGTPDELAEIKQLLMEGVLL